MVILCIYSTYWCMKFMFYERQWSIQFGLKTGCHIGVELSRLQHGGTPPGGKEARGEV
jgi:hypothetical protein